jgi:hypothetical protein
MYPLSPMLMQSLYPDKGLSMAVRQSHFLLLRIGVLLLLLSALTNAVYANPGAQTEDSTGSSAAQCVEALDLLIIMDVSSSMEEQLDIAQQQTSTLMTALRQDIPDLQFGVASLVDYPSAEGNAADYPWRLNQALTADTTQVQAALNQVVLLDGGDPPESYVRALSEAGDAAQIGWRSGARHIIVFWGDASAHNPDPGVDGQPDTEDDLQFDQVLSALRDQAIRIYAISFGNPTDFERMARVTGGAFLSGHSAADLPDLIKTAVQQECATTLLPGGIVPTTPSTGPIAPPPSELPDWFSPWCFLPLLLLLPLFLLLFWKRQSVRRSIRRGMPLPEMAIPTPIQPPAEPVPSQVTSLPQILPVPVTSRPALLVGLGEAGRWTLTYIKQTLLQREGGSDVTLLAFDVPVDVEGQETARIEVITPHRPGGMTEVRLADSEQYWLQGNASRFEMKIRQAAPAYPLLHAWLSERTGSSPHITARLAFLDELPSITPILTTALEGLAQQQGVDVYLIAGLGEALGAGALLDVAQALQLIANQHNHHIALHGIIYLPDVLEFAHPLPQETRAASFAVLRTLERLQTSFGQNPPTSPLFDPLLLGGDAPGTPFESKLFSSCTLLSANREIGPLIGIPPQHGVYPMAADAISVAIELPAATFLHEHRTNVNSRVGQAQHSLDTALYSSFGTFTYQLQLDAIVSEATARLINNLADHLLCPVESTQVQTFFTDLLIAGDYKLYRHAAYEHHAQPWQRDAVIDLLELSAVRGQLRMFLGDGLLRSVRYAGLDADSRNGASIRSLIQHYHQRYLGTPTATGEWSQTITANSEAAIALFRNKLLSDITTLLNSNASGAWSQALTLCDSLSQRMDILHRSLEEYAESLTAGLPEMQTTAQQSAPTLEQRSFDFWRWLLGYPTTGTQEQVLTLHQEWLDTELELLAAQGAGMAAAQMHTYAQYVHSQLRTYTSMLQTEHQNAQQQRMLLRQYRVNQLDMGRVRHDWGMPHTDVIQLRAYTDPERPLPQNERERRYVQDLRSYLDGEHVTHILNRRPATWPDPVKTLPEQICWTWDSATTEPVIYPMLPGTGDTHRLQTGSELWRVAASYYGWIRNICLSDLLASEIDTPTTLARQLSGERSSPAIHYLPTARDQHELHTFLVVPPAADRKSDQLFQQVVTAQQQAGALRVFHQYVMGGDPQRITYLTTYELIGALQTGALTAYDHLAASYTMLPNLQAQIAVATHETVAAHYEEQRQIVRRRLHPRLVDLFQDKARVEIFTHGVLCNIIGPDRRGASRIVLHLDNQSPVAPGSTLLDGQSIWLQALRWFVLAADAPLVQQVASAVQTTLPGLDDTAYEQWLNHGLPADLRNSHDPAEQDLAMVMQAILDQIFV